MAKARSVENGFEPRGAMLARGRPTLLPSLPVHVTFEEPRRLKARYFQGSQGTGARTGSIRRRDAR